MKQISVMRASAGARQTVILKNHVELRFCCRTRGLVGGDQDLVGAVKFSPVLTRPEPLLRRRLPATRPADRRGRESLDSLITAGSESR